MKMWFDTKSIHKKSQKKYIAILSHSQTNGCMFLKNHPNDTFPVHFCRYATCKMNVKLCKQKFGRYFQPDFGLVLQEIHNEVIL